MGDVVRARLEALLSELDPGLMPSPAAHPPGPTLQAEAGDPERDADLAAAAWGPPGAASAGAGLQGAGGPVPVAGASGWGAPRGSGAPRRLAGSASGQRRSATVAADQGSADAARRRRGHAGETGAGRAPTPALADADWLDEPPAGQRVGGPVRRLATFTRRHLAVVAGLGLIGLVATVWGISQARAVPVDAPVPVPLATVSATSSVTAAPILLRVHVIGAVVSPGVISLPEGARVEDAVAAAGGLRPDARPGELNLAQPVADGAQIVVGDAARPGGEMRGDAGPEAGGGAAAAGGASGAKLDLNRASAEQLDGLPGVGPVTAAAILAWRSEHGRFTRVEELQEIEGIGVKTLQKLAPLVRV